MHIIKDENGNLISHGSHHEHCHEHTHSDCQGCDSCGEKNPKEQLTALLGYMLSHNESHAKELDDLASKIAESGMADAAEQIRKGVSEFEKGNMYLSLALSMVKSEQ